MRKNIRLIGLSICLLCSIGMMNAQENPEKIATQMTDQMQKSLQLTEKQYKKIYKLNLKEQKERFKAMQGSGEQRPPMGGDPGMRGGNRPPMGGSEPPMMGEGGGHGRMGEAPIMGKNNSPDVQNAEEEKQKKVAEAKEKKIKKILTTEQYEKWKNEQAAAQRKSIHVRMQKENHRDRNRNS